MLPSSAWQNYSEIFETWTQYFPFFAQEELSKDVVIAFMFHNNALARANFNNFYACRGQM